MTSRRLLKILIGFVLFVPVLLILVLASLVARLLPRKIDVGLGPEPMINNIYHKQALEKFQISAETFASHTYFITNNFDVDLSSSKWPVLFRCYWLHVRAIFRYRILFFYFNGGALAWTYHRPLEGFLLKLAGVKTIVTAYGADVQDLARSKNNVYKAAFEKDCPGFQRQTRSKIVWQIDYWSRWADHVMAGAEWVDYLYRWDSLIPAHFCLPTLPLPASASSNSKTVRILHAPNHKSLKGTEFFLRAIDELRAEGLPVEIRIVQGVPNEVVRQEIRDCDIVADQIIIGWYGFFAIEAMAAAKPVLCYLRPDLIDLYYWTGHLKNRDELPLANVNFATLKNTIRTLVLDEKLRREIGQRGHDYMKSAHSLESVGQHLKSIVDLLGR